jgi:hypothetical protein
MNRTASIRQLATGALVAGMSVAAFGVAGAGCAAISTSATPAIHLPVPRHPLHQAGHLLPKAPRLVTSLQCKQGHMRTVSVDCS